MGFAKYTIGIYSNDIVRLFILSQNQYLTFPFSGIKVLGSEIIKTYDYVDFTRRRRCYRLLAGRGLQRFDHV